MSFAIRLPHDSLHSFPSSNAGSTRLRSRLEKLSAISSKIGIVTIIPPDSAALQVKKYDTPVTQSSDWKGGAVVPFLQSEPPLSAAREADPYLLFHTA